jgi:hypothetical protein
MHKFPLPSLFLGGVLFLLDDMKAFSFFVYHGFVNCMYFVFTVKPYGSNRSLYNCQNLLQHVLETGQKR